MPAHSTYRAPRSRRGFALLVTITLVAFLVLILVGLATFTRVETQVAGNAQTLAQARQNAILALNIALGELQRTAGPDQSITATADLLATTGNTDPSKIRWTGAWRANDPVPIWLVSGTTAQRTHTGAAPGPDADNIELVGANSTDISPNTGNPGNRVVVPAQVITADLPGLGSDVPVGKFAWWVGDEGVKARVNLPDPWAVSDAPTTRIHSWLTSQRAGIELMRDGSVFPARSPDLAKLVELDQLPFLNPGSNLEAFRNLRFHELTAHSRGVLADTASGGLKKDLTAWLRHPADNRVAGAPADTDLIFSPQDMGVSSPVANDNFGIPAWGLIRDFNDTRYDDDENDPAPIESRLATDTRQGIHPVVTLARVGITIEANVGQPLRLHFFPTVVLWNPYSVPLAPSLYEFGMFQHHQDAWFRFIGHPGNTPLGELSMARGSFPTESGSLQRPYPFRILVDDPMPPGESWVFSVADGDDGATYVRANPRPLRRGNNTQNTLVLEGAVPVPAGTTEVRWVVRGTPSGGETALPPLVYRGGQINFMLRPVPSPAPSDWPAFQGYSKELDNSAYQSVTRIGHGSRIAPGATPVSTSPLGPVQPSFGIALRHKMGANNTGIQRWIAVANPRAQVSVNEQYDHFIGNGVQGGTQNAINQEFVTFDDYRASAGLRVNNPTGPAVPAVLAEILPSDVPLSSLAQLQNANLSRIYGYPGNAVGNALNALNNYKVSVGNAVIQRPGNPAGPSGSPGGGDPVTRVYDLSYGLNQALWDRYFFSTIPATLAADYLADPARPLPNARHRFHRPLSGGQLSALLDPTGFDDSAAQLLVEGAFNINSTSVEAWRALLSSTNGLAYDPQTRTSGSALVNPVSRFAVPLGDSTAAWTGYRSLTEPQIEALAQAIVAQVRARGPFRSLADFINRNPAAAVPAHAEKGALQAALDASGVNPANSGASDTLSAGAPGMITQADLLNAIGPVISPRSDTFVIRTYGEATNPATGEPQGKAYAEAIVQRLPEYVDTGLNPDPAAAPQGINQTFGRRFVIVSFRWLTSDDI
jgi:Tfp pilus assembly protein PilX